MIALLRSDFYRLFRSKSLYICAAVECILAALGIIIMKLASKSSGDLGDSYANMLPSGGLAYGFSVFTSDLIMIVGIVIAIYVAAEFTHGTMKNVVSKGFSKIQIYLSKYITMLVATYFIMFVTIIAATVCGTIVLGTLGDMNGEFIAEIFKTLGIEIILFAALTAIYVFFAILIRNLGGVIAVNIIGVLTVGPMIFNVLEYFVKTEINFNEFSLVNNIALYTTQSAVGNDYIRSAIVALVYFVVTMGLGIVAFRKSDIK